MSVPSFKHKNVFPINKSLITSQCLIENSILSVSALVAHIRKLDPDLFPGMLL